MLVCGPRRLVRLPAVTDDASVYVRRTVDTGDVPVPLDQPHKLGRLSDIKINLNAERTAADDPLDEVLVSVLCRARMVAIGPQACSFLETNASTLFAYAMVLISTESIRRSPGTLTDLAGDEHGL